MLSIVFSLALLAAEETETELPTIGGLREYLLEKLEGVLCTTPEKGD